MSDIRSELFEKITTFLKRLQIQGRKIFIAFLFGFIGTIFSLRLYIWDYFETMMRSNMPENISSEVSIITKTPFEVFLTQVKIGLIVGILLTIPVISYVIYNEYIDRDIFDISKVPNYVLGITLGFGITMFSIGLIYSYNVFFPIIFDFLATVTVETGVVPSYSISSWTVFIIILSISFGIAAQIPILLPVLIVYNVVSYNTIKEGWRYWIVATVTLGAFLSPPDPISQMLWAIPLILLYVLSLIISRVILQLRYGEIPSEQTSENGDTNTGTNEQTSENDDSDSYFDDLEIQIPDAGESLISDYYIYFDVILSTLRSNIFIIGSIFILSLFVSFYLLFSVATEAVLEQFRMSIENGETLNIITLHPVELIFFQAKLSIIVSIIITSLSSLVVIWPQLIKDRLTKISTQQISIYLVSVISIFLLTVIGSYIYVIPELIQLLIYDAMRINAIISYQINSFFWLIVKISVVFGIFVSLYYSIIVGYLTDIIPYKYTMDNWRNVVFFIYLISILITPSGILKAFIISIPISISYLMAVATIYILESN